MEAQLEQIEHGEAGHGGHRARGRGGQVQLAPELRFVMLNKCVIIRAANEPSAKFSQ